MGTLPYRSTQLRYSLIYVLISFAVLLFLNIYCSETTKTLFHQSKKSAMTEKCQVAASELAELDVLSQSTISSVIARMTTLRSSDLLVTDHAGLVIYDSTGSFQGKYVLYPEVVEALRGYTSFSWEYHDGIMRSYVACPLLSYGTLSGAVYITETDLALGALMKSLQSNILSITLVLEIALILFSVFFYSTFTRRLKRIFTSMRIIREGEYSHKVDMGGRDELTSLGDEFNALTERLQTSENKRRQFVSDASHELKTPLASIKLLSDSILQNDMDMDTVKEFVGDIGNEAERLNRMSQKLLLLSKIEAMPESDAEIVDMAPTAQRVVKMLSAIAAENGITICKKLDVPCPVLIPEDDLYQIVFNLAENGIKYNTPGGTLNVSLRRQDDNAILEVADTGMGIPEDAISHVFERFYRVDKARSRKTGGSGLGLAIVHNLVRRNGGTISVESALGRGTVFTVTFPLFDTEDVP